MQQSLRDPVTNFCIQFNHLMLTEEHAQKNRLCSTQKKGKHELNHNPLGHESIL